MEKYRLNHQYVIVNSNSSSFLESKEYCISVDNRIVNVVKNMLFNPNPIEKEKIQNKIGKENFDLLLKQGVFLEEQEANLSKIYHQSTSMGENYFPWLIKEEEYTSHLKKCNKNYTIRKSVREYNLEESLLKENILVIEKLVNKCYANNYFEGHRGIASAGGLYPLNLYLAIKNDNYYTVYTYDYTNQKFNIYSSIIKMSNFFVGQDIEYEETPFYIFVSYSPDRNQMKYGDRGYRFALLEAGMFAQQFNNLLLKNSMNMINLGSYIEYNFEKNLHINEWLIHCIALGKGK